MHGQFTSDAGADPSLGIRSLELDRFGLRVDADERLNRGLVELIQCLNEKAFVSRSPVTSAHHLLQRVLQRFEIPSAVDDAQHRDAVRHQPVEHQVIAAREAPHAGADVVSLDTYLGELEELLQKLLDLVDEPIGGWQVLDRD
jgi:hypothetical protein